MLLSLPPLNLAPKLYAIVPRFLHPLPLFNQDDWRATKVPLAYVREKEPQVMLQVVTQVATIEVIEPVKLVEPAKLIVPNPLN